MSWKSGSQTRQDERRWSLAARLTVWYAASAFTLVLVATGFLYWALISSLDRQNERFLIDEVRILRGLLRDHPEDANALRQEVEWESDSRQGAQIFVRVLDDNGRALLETPGMKMDLTTERFPEPVAAAAEPSSSDLGIRANGGPRRAYRIVSARAAVGRPGTESRVLQVALDRTHDEELLAEFRRYSWLVLGLSLIGCTLAGYRIARRGIRPIQDITQTARRIRSTTLDERLALSGLPAELAALAETFNDMLDRLEESFARLARFSADIAHELRTPVNNLRGEAEVALGKPRSVEEYREVLGSCLEECARLARMIDSLLFLARAEHPQTQIARERIDVGRELATMRDFYEAAASEAGVQLTVAGPAPIFADLDRSLWQRAVGNLVENALAHTPAGGAITLSVVRDNGHVCVEVTDSGCGIPAIHLPHLFDRFYRVDRARSAGGMGLGLAIVKSIAELHGGNVHVASSVGQGTRVSLTFPDSFPGDAAS